MLKNNVVKRLVEFKQKDFPITSAYLTVSNASGDWKSHLVELKKMIRYKKNTTYFNQLSAEEQASVLADFDKIQQWFSEGFDSSQYSSGIVFSCHGADFWEQINLKHKLGHELVVQPKPYIRPLAAIFSDFRNYAVVLVDKAKARVFECHFGEYIEHLYIAHDDIESINVGGFGGTEERRVERSMRQDIIQHYKDVAKSVFKLNQEKDFKWVVIGGRRETIREFEDYLHDYVASKVTDHIVVPPAAPLNDVLKKVRETEKKAREKFEQNLLKEYNEQEQKSLGVSGIRAAIRALRKSQIQTLLIEEGYKIKGVFCRNDDFIDTEIKAECPLCGAPLERTSDLIENMLHIALDQSVDIQYISQSMQEYGHIAAILRYPMAPKSV